jgi:hypothetical protein
MQTTLNMRVDILKKITAQARARGVSRSEMIMFLLKMTMDDVTDPGRFGSMVQYQERGMPGRWHAFHIKLRVDDYEYLLDLRRLMKMSVSLILAYSVQRYLTRQSRSNRPLWYKHKGDKNRFRNYVLIKELIGNIICWKLIWGFPPDLGRHLAN